jgi:hypothetical protein
MYGPYIKTLPTLPVGSLKGQTAITVGAIGTAGTVTTAGWLFTGTDFNANLAGTEKDASNVAYNTY